MERAEVKAVATWAERILRVLATGALWHLASATECLPKQS